MDEFEVEIYRLPNGREPAVEFINSTDRKMKRKIITMMQILDEEGNRLREPYSKVIDDGILELRSKVGSNITRILYFFCKGGKIVLANGFEKKTQQTPRSEIEKAIAYRENYLNGIGDTVSYKECFADILQDPSFKVESAAFRSEYRLVGDIISARKQRRWTQQELAEKTGLSRTTISAIENQAVSPSLQTIGKIAYVLGMELRFMPIQE